ncbi:MAG: hypothetical protein KGZ83_06210 [Sulfuricella sp.]|nr:hypothetical protein [Sulfuricella sp.]
MLKLPPLYHVGQLLFTQRVVKKVPRGTKIKVKSLRTIINGYRYEIEWEAHQREWCYEFDLGKMPPS